MSSHISWFTGLAYIAVGRSLTTDCALCCGRTAWGTLGPYFYFKPMMSESKHKHGGDVGGTATVFFKVLQD